MSDRKKIGVEVDEQVWERFRQFCQDRHGRVRGTLGEEVEIALKERMDAATGPSQLQRIEDDIAAVKAMLAESDGAGVGGVVPPSDGADARARADAADDGADRPATKPAPNQPRAKKAAWLADQVRQKTADKEDAFARPAIGTLIDREYGFEGDARDALIDQVVVDLGAEVDPTDPEGDRIVWGDTADDRWQEHRQDAEADADAELDRILDAQD